MTSPELRSPPQGTVLKATLMTSCVILQSEIYKIIEHKFFCHLTFNISVFCVKREREKKHMA